MAKPIIFIDFYKTINFDHFWRFLPEPEFHKAENWVFKHNTYFWGAWMRGEYISEEINEVVSKAIDIPYDRLWDAFVEGCSSSRIEDHYLQALKCLSKHYEIILVTDNMDSFDRFFLPNARVDEYFDAIINSYNSNQLKTDHNGKTFTDEIQKRGADIKECVLLDDHKNTCNLFAQLGGKPMHITEYTPTEFWLDELKKAV